ncbi:amino acid adenylation domain-containing protein [Micromonospora sp. KC207]|nr:amino acid adenylation domain-containing protein [Micromonospora sp. KC207]
MSGPSVTVGGRTWPYSQLRAAADRVATALRRGGVGREDVVGVPSARTR